MNSLGPHGRTPLQCAVRSGNLTLVKLLLKNGALINYKNENNFTALMEALERGDKGIVSFLVHRGADVNAIGPDGWTPLHFALKLSNDSVGLVELLLIHGANASAKSNVHGDPHGIEPYNTPLMMAVLENNIDAVKLLLKNGAEVNHKCRNGFSALSLASELGRNNLVKMLLAYGADLNATDDNGRTPLDLAIWNGHTETVKVLLSHGRNLK